MFGALVEALKAIIGLSKTAQDSKKTKLEIEKLKREKKKEERLIHPATMDDIIKYDSKVKFLTKYERNLCDGWEIKAYPVSRFRKIFRRHPVLSVSLVFMIAIVIIIVVILLL